MRLFPSSLRRLALAAPLMVMGPMTAGFVAPALAHGDDAPNVVASIKPIHGIASAIMKDVGEPVLLLDGASSPHSYALRPSEARALNDADLVIYVSHALESFLEKPLQSLSGHSHQLELVALKDLTLHDVREGGTWESHDHDHGHEHEEHDHGHGNEHEEHANHEHDHSNELEEHADHEHDHGNEHEQHADHGHEHDHEHEHEHEHEEHADHHHDHDGVDAHIWMDPANGAKIAIAIANELAEIDPEHAADYQANLQTLLASLTNLGHDLRTKVAPIKNKPYVVFHDAYQYLETGFELNAVGSITVSPEQKPGAKRLHEIEHKIRDTGAVCIFAEPQFRPAIVEAIVSDTGIRSGTLDPLGSDLPAGPDTYQEILAQNVGALVDCLGNGS